jgi:hypothetical protein
MARKPRPAEAQRGVSYTARVWTWRLWGLPGARPELLAALATLALLVVSRFALLPAGPWEWDETLFARGLLKFDLPSHFPHPPGFPLWMALGWVMLHLVGDPLLGFQLLSAVASCLCLFPLAALGRRVAPAPVAAAAALAVLFIPGVWLHAGRGFTDTASAFFALWAAAVAVWGLDARRATGFTLLVTAAFLIRPILLPPLGLLWLAGAIAGRPARRMVPGVLLSVAATAAAIGGLVLAQGSWAGFASAFLTHASTHARNLVEHNPGGVLDLGLVKGVGGPWLAAGVAVLAVLGIVVWARRAGRRGAVAWAVILAVTVIQLVWLQNRRFPRYAVPVDMAIAPLLAGVAATVAPPALAAGTLAALGATWAVRSYPLLVEQHTRHLPGWDAVQFTVETAKRTGVEVVVEPGLHPFLSYREQLDRRAGEPWRFMYYLAPSSPDSRQLPAGRYLLLTEYPFHYFAPLLGGERRFPAVSQELRPLTQERFLNPAVFGSVPLPLSGWWLPEQPRGGEKFMWGGAGAELFLPSLPAGTALRLDIAPASGPSPLEVVVNGALAFSLPGDALRRRVWVEPGFFSATSANRLVFRRAQGYIPGGGDRRPLSVQIFGWRTVGPQQPWRVDLANANSLEEAHAVLSGTWTPERLGTRAGVWTKPLANVTLPAGEGSLELELWAPRPTPANLEVFCRGRRIAGPWQPGPDPAPFTLTLSAADLEDGQVVLELRSTPYRPASAGHGDDTRDLGVVLGTAAFVPKEPSFPALD